MKKSESVLSSMLLTIGVEGSIFFLTHWISGLLARESGSIWRAYFLLLTFKGCYCTSSCRSSFDTLSLDNCLMNTSFLIKRTGLGKK